MDSLIKPFTPQKAAFGRHETFALRYGWLTKGFQASEAILALCFPDQRQFQLDLKQLKEKSIINYRKFSREYRIWEGSDFDLQASLR